MNDTCRKESTVTEAPAMVNLVTLRDAVKQQAERLDWCGDAERAFRATTGVKTVGVWKSCGCCLDRDAAKRFILPDDAPEAVPARPVLEALLEQYREYMPDSGCCCCAAHWDGDPETLEGLQVIANVLPGSPQLAELVKVDA
jgi:hypothetical protein